MKLMLLALGGAGGALLRYAVSGVAYKCFGTSFPYGTLTVNVIGALMIGILSGMFERFIISPNMKIFIFIGILGAFTTFSTYSFESFNLFRDGEYKLALFNILVTNVTCIAMVFIGFIISRQLIEIIK